MSVSGMNRGALERQLARHVAQPRGRRRALPGDPGEPLGAPDPEPDAAAEAARETVPAEPVVARAPAETKVLEDLARYVPTEIITFYLAFLGVATVTNGDYTARWIGLGVFIAVTPLVVWIDWKAKQRPLPPARRERLPHFNWAAAVVAFLAWAFALPGTPFEDLGIYDAKWAGFAALVISFALGRIGAVWGPMSPVVPTPAPAPA